jgi:hypothetical protein
MKKSKEKDRYVFLYFLDFIDMQQYSTTQYLELGLAILAGDSNRVLAAE